MISEVRILMEEACRNFKTRFGHSSAESGENNQNIQSEQAVSTQGFDQKLPDAKTEF
jgi:hypothetical protein